MKKEKEKKKDEWLGARQTNQPTGRQTDSDTHMRGVVRAFLR